VNPQELASRLHESPTYMAKVLRSAGPGGIGPVAPRRRGWLRAGADAKEHLTLLDVVEACQGPIRANYCAEVPVEQVPLMCGYHQAMHELKESLPDRPGQVDHRS
jgi:DNA-binding IscR family transcriptional regulator